MNVERRTVWNRLAERLRGVPRSVRQLDRSLQLLGSLRQLGWHASVQGRIAVTRDGSPLLWYTYGAIRWLHARLRPEDRVFEYGAGHSTIWYAARVHEVVSVEHNPRWADRVRRMAPKNAKVLERQPGGPESPYVRAIEEAGGPFEVIAIDGADRLDCARVASRHLTPDGIIVLDNSDRPEYQPAMSALKEEGLGRIDFSGVNPGLGTLFATSTFSRHWDRWMGNVPLGDPNDPGQLR